MIKKNQPFVSGDMTNEMPSNIHVTPVIMNNLTYNVKLHAFHQMEDEGDRKWKERKGGKKQIAIFKSVSMFNFMDHLLIFAII